MYRIAKRVRISFAHRIPDHETCGKIHGHNYLIEVVISGSELKGGEAIYEGSMLLDLKRVDWLLDKIKEKFDHKTLLWKEDPLASKIECEPLDFIPTVENLSRYIYYYLQKVLQTKYYMKNVRIERVRVWETENSWGEYYE